MRIGSLAFFIFTTFFNIPLYLFDIFEPGLASVVFCTSMLTAIIAPSLDNLYHVKVLAWT